MCRRHLILGLTAVAFGAGLLLAVMIPSVLLIFFIALIVIGVGVICLRRPFF